MKSRRQKTRKILLLVSMLLFPVVLNYLSPYLVISGGFAGVLAGSGVVFAGMFVSSLVFGRAYCGWVCPPGGLQEVCAGISGKTTGHRQNIVKYIVWVPWLAAIVLGFVSAGGIRQIDMIYLTDGGISANSIYGYIIYFLVVATIVVLSFTLGKRSFCHCLCWMAPFMVLGSLLTEKLRTPRLRLRAEVSKCTGCGACTRACPMSLPVADMVKKEAMFHTECMLCAGCADTCPRNAIELAFCLPPKREKAPAASPLSNAE
jgi:ferredoxin-type protein NapH